MGRSRGRTLVRWVFVVISVMVLLICAVVLSAKLFERVPIGQPSLESRNSSVPRDGAQPSTSGSAVHRSCTIVECPADRPMHQPVPTYDAIIYLPSLTIRACDEATPWDKCDVESCCMRGCEGTECPAGAKPNNVSEYWQYWPKGACLEEIANKTVMQACDIAGCCDDIDALEAT